MPMICTGAAIFSRFENFLIGHGPKLRQSLQGTLRGKNRVQRGKGSKQLGPGRNGLILAAVERAVAFRRSGPADGVQDRAEGIGPAAGRQLRRPSQPIRKLPSALELPGQLRTTGSLGAMF